MRHAAGELANGFHLLGLSQLFLKLAAFRHIRVAAHNLRRAAGRILDKFSFIAKPANASIFVAQTMFGAAVAVGKKIVSVRGFLLLLVRAEARNFPAGPAPFGNGTVEDVSDVFADPRWNKRLAIHLVRINNDGAAREQVT